MEAKQKDQKYKIITKLDSGGMAEVFKAEMETVKGFKKTVAIKRIRPHLIKEEKFVKMFMDEARLSLYLQHANIATIFDVGMSDKHFFIVMEFVEGLNLRALLQLLPSPVLPPHVAVSIVQSVCEALDYAHNLKDPSTGAPFNIVHRDISPPNVLLSRQGEIKLVDFGLAKASSQSERSEPGIIKGKYSYLSPEAAAGLEVDHRTDIFASGIILYELLTGTRLFLGEDNYQTVLAVKECQVPPLTTMLPGAPKELEAILSRALERDPERRYQSAQEMGDDLTKLLFQIGQAVTKRDLAQYVIEALEVKKLQEPSILIARDSLLKEFIEDEINALISIGEFEEDPSTMPGAAPIDLMSMSGAQALAELSQGGSGPRLSERDIGGGVPLGEAAEVQGGGELATGAQSPLTVGVATVGKERGTGHQDALLASGAAAQEERVPRKPQQHLSSGPTGPRAPSAPSMGYRTSGPLTFSKERDRVLGRPLLWVLLLAGLCGVAALVYLFLL